jgi:hypothetical protein
MMHLDGQVRTELIDISIKERINRDFVKFLVAHGKDYPIDVSIAKELG